MKKYPIMKGILTLTVLMLLSGACRQPLTDDTKEVPRVRVSKVSREKISFPVNASGIVVPAKEIKLSFKTGGIIHALYADEGKRVKKGTLLAALDLSEIESQVKQATGGYEKALRDYNRAMNLYADSVVTLEQLQNAETAMNVAKAQSDAAAFNLGHSRIYAPEDGVILKRLVESHEMVASGYPVFLFGTTGTQWKIKAGLADRNYVRIRYGDSADVTFDAWPQEHFKAVVSQISEAANPLTGTYEVELDLLPGTKRLAPGFVAGLIITPSGSESFYRIPVEALVEAEDQNGYVFVINDASVAKKIQIELAGIYGTWAAVSAGLEGNEELATEGSSYLRDGELVIVVR